MKKNIGSQLALYPMPVTVIGAMNGDKPTWTLVAHVGIIGHDRVLVRCDWKMPVIQEKRRKVGEKGYAKGID